MTRTTNRYTATIYREKPDAPPIAGVVPDVELIDMVTADLCFLEGLPMDLVDFHTSVLPAGSGSSRWAWGRDLLGVLHAHYGTSALPPQLRLLRDALRSLEDTKNHIVVVIRTETVPA